MQISPHIQIGVCAGLACVFLALGCSSTQEPTRLSTSRIVLQPKRDSSGPDIKILQPSLPHGRPLFVQDDQLVVRGRASDGSGLRKLTVADLAATIDPTGSFTVRLGLQQGKNTVKVVAEDTLGNPASFEFDVVCDTRPPFLEILQPRVAANRDSIAVPEGPILLRGRVRDESGISRVVVNGRQVMVSPDSGFNHTVTDADTLRIEVTDGSGLRTMRRLSLIRPKPKSLAEALAGKNHALLIGIDRYKGSWRPLKTAVRDANGLADELRGTYGFARLWTLFNEQATRAHILDRIRELNDSLSLEDNLLIFFSGHGGRSTSTGEGFWVPVDATSLDAHESLVANQEIVDVLRTMKLRHILVVADAAFTARMSRGLPSPIPRETTPSSLVLRKSRSVLISGGDEPVEGGREKHSSFAYQLINVLRTMKGDYGTGGEIFEQVQQGLVASGGRQQPAFGKIEGTGDEGGEFIFIRNHNESGYRSPGR